jgi:metal-responsive CopG/Arc/MetJ family transcriptional regulator
MIGARSKKARTAATKARTMAARTSPRKIIVEFPPELFSRMDHMREEVSVNRSAFIRSAVEHYIRALERRKLEKELAEGYAANAELDAEITREFAHVDAEHL